MKTNAVLIALLLLIADSVEADYIQADCPRLMHFGDCIREFEERALSITDRIEKHKWGYLFKTTIRESQLKGRDLEVGSIVYHLVALSIEAPTPYAVFRENHYIPGAGALYAYVVVDLHLGNKVRHEYMPIFSPDETTYLVYPRVYDVENESHFPPRSYIEVHETDKGSKGPFLFRYRRCCGGESYDRIQNASWLTNEKIEIYTRKHVGLVLTKTNQGWMLEQK